MAGGFFPKIGKTFHLGELFTMSSENRACGKPFKETDVVVTLGLRFVEKVQSCEKIVCLSYNGITVPAKVLDGLADDERIGASRAVFKMFANHDETWTIPDVQWKFCDEGLPQRVKSPSGFYSFFFNLGSAIASNFGSKKDCCCSFFSLALSHCSLSFYISGGFE
jgi:hypothetical protein